MHGNKRPRRTGSRSFTAKLRAIGFATYDDYLASPHWQATRERFRHCPCLVCEKTPIVLHHVTYRRLGAERDDDLRPLCRACHQSVHDAIKAMGVCGKQSDWVIGHLRDGLTDAAVLARLWIREATDRNQRKRVARQQRKALRALRRAGDEAAIRAEIARRKRENTGYTPPLWYADPAAYAANRKKRIAKKRAKRREMEAALRAVRKK